MLNAHLSPVVNHVSWNLEEARLYVDYQYDVWHRGYSKIAEQHLPTVMELTLNTSRASFPFHNSYA